MNILICGAQDEEISSILDSDIKKIDKDSYLSLKISNNNIFVKKTGIGKTSTGLQLGLFLSNVDVDLIINIGSCGSLSSDLKIGDTLVATKVCYYDVDLTAFNHPLGMISDEPLYFSCCKEYVDTINTYKLEHVKNGLLISGDKFLTENNFSKDLLENFDNPLACDMEGASVAQVANDLNIPFLVIRSITDEIQNKNNRGQYENTLLKASKRSIEITNKLISDLI